MSDHVPPARPHRKLTADGRRVREVLTYSRRGNRFTPKQAEAWKEHHERWVIRTRRWTIRRSAGPTGSAGRRR